MLQRRQLEQVAVRFAPNIATLQSFFQNAEPPLATDRNGLQALTWRLHHDASFRRDLGSHLLIVAHSGSSTLGAADLLAITAIAAAGVAGAADSHADDAHDLMRFVLAIIREPDTWTANTLATTTVLPTGSPQTSRKWIAAVAACLTVLLAGSIGLYLRNKPAQTAPLSAAAPTLTTSRQAAEPAEATQNEVEEVAPQSGRAKRLVLGEPQPRHTTRPSETQAPSEHLANTVPAVTRQSSNAPVEQRSGAALNSTRQPPAALPVGNRVVNGAIPSSVLSQRLDARTVPLDEFASGATPGRPYPHLLRRNHQVALQPDSDNEPMLMANNTPLPRPGEPSHGNLPRATGTVRPVSLGMMAANIMYSPAPAYPPAAAAARVQGTVTIQAEIERDGSVASARVVSGPPLLRDAALDAVQQWRYKPRLVAGKPVTAAATAVVEFALP